ncbi:MAG: hypothetical protein IKY67_00990 [Paludibacteraceae bacterium]|nr:hypothetical protein [Lachnospiraceae bacterium]MBR5822701.1 hypothetical protein [Paludibacteraceae bacterium]
MYTIYLRPIEKNDATSFYVDIIKESIRKSGHTIREVSSVNDIGKNDVVLVITIRTYFFVWLRNPRQRIVIWFQGILPEENLMMFKGCKGYLKFIYNRILEKLALVSCYKAFFVSEAMSRHYQKIYAYKGNKHFIMPCFNQELEEKYFNDAKYQQPTFVYAGNLAEWQCVEKTLELFCKIRERVPNAKITLLTKEKDKAMRMAEQFGITNMEVKYVPYTELNSEMSKYKYGFLLREDTAVNNVATPTKMNSYMACGVIPIFSNVIGDFKDVFQCVKYKISVSSFDDCLKTLIYMENEKINGNDLLIEYKKIFATYYSKEWYVENIAKFLQ